MSLIVISVSRSIKVKFNPKRFSPPNFYLHFVVYSRLTDKCRFLDRRTRLICRVLVRTVSNLPDTISYMKINYGTIICTKRVIEYARHNSDSLRTINTYNRSCLSTFYKLLWIHPFQPALVIHPPPIQWVPRALSSGVMRQGREADHSPPTSTEINKSIHPLPHTFSWRSF
jgi:hypothetical protein